MRGWRALLVACAPLLADDRATFEKVCGACHSTSMIDSFRSEPDWRDTVSQMVQIGAKGTSQEFESVMRYLLRSWTSININAATAAEIAPVLDVPDRVAEAVVRYRAEHGNFTTLDVLESTNRGSGWRRDAYSQEHSLPGL